MEAPKPGNLVFAGAFTEGASVIRTPQKPLRRSNQTEKGCGEGRTSLGWTPRSATSQRRGGPGPGACQAELATPSADQADTDFKLKPPAENLQSLRVTAGSALPTCLKAAKSASHKGVGGQDTRPGGGTHTRTHTPPPPHPPASRQGDGAQLCGRPSRSVPAAQCAPPQRPGFTASLLTPATQKLLDGVLRWVAG